MGREITNQVSGEAAIPEEIPVLSPIFESAGERAEYPILCRVDVDAAAQRLTLRPRREDLRSVEEMHLADIGARLSDGLSESVPVYFGTVEGS